MYKEIANNLVSEYVRVNDEVVKMTAKTLIEGEAQSVVISFQWANDVDDLIIALMESVCVTAMIKSYYVEDSNQEGNSKWVSLLSQELQAVEVRYRDDFGIDRRRRSRRAREKKFNDLRERGPKGDWSFLYE